MKRFTSLLIGCSLALAGVAMAQQPNEEASPGKKKKQGTEQTQPAQAKPGATAAKPHATAVREHGARNEPRTMNEPAATKGRKGGASQESASPAGTENTGQAAGSATPSTRIFVRSQNRNRFRQLPTTRTIGFKEVISGRVRSTKYSARIVRNGTTRVGIGRVTTG